MQTLWAPWRMAYINKVDEIDCIFCELPKASPSDDKKNLILYRGKEAFIMMNLYPYSNGHIMVAPYSHCATLPKLDEKSLQSITLLTQASAERLEKIFNPDGMNIGMNIGRVAGAGFDQHVHMHLVPRWNGDHNFMPVVGDVKVIPQHIEQTYDQMLPHFQDLDIG